MKNKLVILFGLLPLLVAAQCNSAPPQPPPVPVVVIDAGPEPVADAAPAPTPAPTPNPPPPPIVVVDAGPAPTTPVAAACANLAALKCSGGMSGCETALQHMVDANITKVDLPCLTGARTKSAARACKAVACP